MKNPSLKTCFLILSLILLCVTPAAGEETSYPYRAVIKTTVAGVYEVANWRTPLLTQALLNEEIEVLSTSGIYVFARVPDGYSGYIRQADITDDLSSIDAAGDKVIVKSNYAAVLDSFGREIILAPMSSVINHPS